MSVRKAFEEDFEILKKYECHITEAELKLCLEQQRIIIAEENGVFCGWLRWGYFWDSIPFMNMLYIIEEKQGSGFGKKLVEHWEKEMFAAGHKTVLTSTVSDEFAQHFYVKLGYKTIGGFTLGKDPYEIIMEKEIGYDRL